MKAYTVVVMYFAFTNVTVPASPRLQLIALPAFIALAMRIRGRAVLPVVTVSASLLGVWFMIAALRLVRGMDPDRAIRFFTFSNTYLALLFLAVAVDVLVRSAML